MNLPDSNLDVPAFLRSRVCTVPNFPKRGVSFKDISPLLADPLAFKHAIVQMSNPFRDANVQKIVALDARGFLFAAPIAYRLNVGIVPARKKGKLPRRVIEQLYVLEYGATTLEMHEDAILRGERVLIVDDVLATGGTARAAAQLVQKLGGNVVGFSCLIELAFLKGRTKLYGVPQITSVLSYES